MIITTTPRTGTFAGREVFTNTEGKGIFTRLANGQTVQHKGTLQTPIFSSAAQLAAYLRRTF